MPGNLVWYMLMQQACNKHATSINHEQNASSLSFPQDFLVNFSWEGEAPLQMPRMQAVATPQ